MKFEIEFGDEKQKKSISKTIRDLISKLHEKLEFVFDSRDEVKNGKNKFLSIERDVDFEFMFFSKMKFYTNRVSILKKKLNWKLN